MYLHDYRDTTLTTTLIPENELDRQAALDSYHLLDTPADPDFDAITLLATEICRTPVAMINLVDRGRVWFKSKQRVAQTEAPRDIVFCSYAILTPEQATVIPDTRQDERFAHNPMVTGPAQVHFYAGVPLVDESGFALGTLCVMDNRPRYLTQNQLTSLEALAKWVQTQFKLRRSELQLADARQQIENAQKQLATLRRTTRQTV